MILESASPENATPGAGVVLQDLEGRPAGILFQPKARRDGPSPTASSPAAAAVAVRAQLGNGMGPRRRLTLKSVMRDLDSGSWGWKTAWAAGTGALRERSFLFRGGRVGSSVGPGTTTSNPVTSTTKTSSAPTSTATGTTAHYAQ
ncbi:hypothetical protein FRC10_002736, partial [Ceratobasidium sp. 414]